MRLGINGGMTRGAKSAAAVGISLLAYGLRAESASADHFTNFLSQGGIRIEFWPILATVVIATGSAIALVVASAFIRKRYIEGDETLLRKKEERR
ncbi:MAG: hypothetical protein HYU86_08350 [Chloroflexi bacterium]|nr:hypothetical protein [Chloroflexota bacterium]